jgi:hypothetical protein
LRAAPAEQEFPSLAGASEQAEKTGPLPIRQRNTSLI